MENAVIVSGVRTAVGAFGGTLKATPVVELGALVLKETLKRAGLRPVATKDLTQFEPDMFKGKGMTDLEKKAYDYDKGLQEVQVDEVIMGNVVGAGQGQNVAQAGHDPGRHPQGDQCLHGEQGLRLGHEGRGPGSPVHPGGRGRGGAGRRHGEHEPHPLCPAGGQVGGADEQRGPGGSHGLRRALRDLLRIPHGAHGGEHRRLLRHLQAGAG